ncbi:MAG: hypothetical protein HYS18_10930 [Burkholderiales bacterium]|nr:hypothetical protein [Burkholderiales bacterium]
MNKKAHIATLLIFGVIAAPVVVYLCIFGAAISSNHARWAEFGSAIGGIYSPIVALLTLAVLLRQVALQSQMNVHEFDQAYLQQAREDIEFYSKQLEQIMNGIALPGQTLRLVLHQHFAHPIANNLDSHQLRQLAADVHHLIPPVFDIWTAVYPILAGLEAGKTRMYNMTLGSSTQKLIALLSFETCVALDNFHRTRTEGRMQVNYIFSPVLRKP